MLACCCFSAVGWMAEQHIWRDMFEFDLFNLLKHTEASVLNRVLRPILCCQTYFSVTKQKLQTFDCKSFMAPDGCNS